MNNDEFDRLAALTNLGPKALEGARMVLVDGVSSRSAGRALGYSRESVVTRAVARLRKLTEAEYCSKCGQRLNNA